MTKKEKVVSLSVYASASYRSRYTGEVIPGYVSASYETVAEDGTIEKRSYGTSDVPYSAGIGAKISNQDSVTRFIGEESDAEVTSLVDKIIAHCTEAKISCPSKEVLLLRSLESLQDKAKDLDIKDQGNQ